MTRVRCYAGASYPERPVAFEWEDRWVDVAEVLWSARTPEGLVFDVQTNDRRQYRLKWNQVTEKWIVLQGVKCRRAK
jgi:hypothetical protein